MIDYNLIAESISFYEEKSYKRIESPWLVSEEVSDITRPGSAAQYVIQKENKDGKVELKRKAFVASGEQSFLYLASKGYLPDGAYQTVTPCIRNDSFDETHVKYFVKNELIMFGYSLFPDDEAKKEALDVMVNDATSFFGMYASSGDLCVIPTGDMSFDIEYNGVEIGSYGYRDSLLGPWVYGTGLAEPRFSRMLKKAEHHE